MVRFQNDTNFDSCLLDPRCLPSTEGKMCDDPDEWKRTQARRPRLNSLLPAVLILNNEKQSGIFQIVKTTVGNVIIIIKANQVWCKGLVVWRITRGQTWKSNWNSGFLQLLESQAKERESDTIRSTCLFCDIIQIFNVCSLLPRVFSRHFCLFALSPMSFWLAFLPVFVFF